MPGIPRVIALTKFCKPICYFLKFDWMFLHTRRTNQRNTQLKKISECTNL